MALGEGNTWHAKCHTHKLHVSRLLRRRTCWGGGGGGVEGVEVC